MSRSIEDILWLKPTWQLNEKLCHPQQSVKDAMSEYAEQEAIAFVEWMGQNEYNERNRNGQANNPELTLKQLYQIYKSQP